MHAAVQSDEGGIVDWLGKEWSGWNLGNNGQREKLASRKHKRSVSYRRLRSIGKKWLNTLRVAGRLPPRYKKQVNCTPARQISP